MESVCVSALPEIYIQSISENESLQVGTQRATTECSKKDFRKEVTRLKKEVRLFISLSNSESKDINNMISQSSEPSDSAVGNLSTVTKRQSERLEEIKTNIFSCIDNLPILFMNRRKKVSGADNPAKNLIGFGKPTLVDRYLIEFFEKNFSKIDEKTFSDWFPVLYHTGIGSRIELQSIFNLLIRTTHARIKGRKRKEQISVSQMKDMDKLIERTNKILLKTNKNPIHDNIFIGSSDILKILNALVSKDSDMTHSQRELLMKHREDVRHENLIAKKLLLEYSNK